MISQSGTTDAHFCYESLNTSCSKHIYSTSLRVSLYILLGVVIILTVCGNLLVIVAIAHFKQLHTPTNYLVLSLAVADFLLGAVVMPPSMVRSLETCWYLGNIFCKIHTSTDFMLCTASILNLLLISIDRYYAVCQPLRYQTKITNGVIMTMVLISWTLSLFYGFGVIFLELNNWGVEYIYKEGLYCEGSCAVLQSRISSITASLLLFFIPGFLIILIYIKIVLIARKQACVIQSQICANSKLENSKITLNKTEPKATKMLGIVFGVYLTCWAPWFLCNLVYPVIFFSSPLLSEVVTWLAYLNSGINPIIYAFSFSWFQKPFQVFFRNIVFNGN